MEFNFTRNSYSSMRYTSPPHPPPPPEYSFNAQLPLRGGGDYRTDHTENSYNVRRLMIRREIEKEKIREEIMAEMARKQALEDEVRREILMEKDQFQVPLVMHNHAYSRGFAAADYGVVGTMSMSSSQNHRRAMMMPEVESVPPQAPKGKLLILLSKPKESDVVREKMIAKTPATKHCTELPLAGVKSKTDNFSCALCQVAATSEQALNDHIRGKKHKANAVKLKAKKPGMNSKWGNKKQKKLAKKKNFGKRFKS